MDLFGKFGSSLPALIVAAAGVGLAWICLKVNFAIAILVAIVALAVGLACYGLGHAALTRTTPRPVRALRFFEFSILAPGTLAAGASAGLIFLAVEEAAKRSAENKALVAAAVGAATTFITTVLIKDAEDADGAWVARRVKKEFQSVFKGKFTRGSPSELAVYSNINPSGWDWTTRRERAHTIEERSPQDNVPEQ